MPADGFDAAAKKIRDLGTSRWQLWVAARLNPDTGPPLT
jgi:hypothetical protein